MYACMVILLLKCNVLRKSEYILRILSVISAPCATSQLNQSNISMLKLESKSKCTFYFKETKFSPLVNEKKLHVKPYEIAKPMTT